MIFVTLSEVKFHIKKSIMSKLFQNLKNRFGAIYESDPLAQIMPIGRLMRNMQSMKVPGVAN